VRVVLWLRVVARNVLLKKNDEYDFSDSTSFSSEVSKEVCLLGPSLGMELLLYRFEPPDPSPIDSPACSSLY